ncbi:MAG: hypothetical protein ACJA0T_000945 [Colwellia sp.]|jgi:hypothetical protein
MLGILVWTQGGAVNSVYFQTYFIGIMLTFSYESYAGKKECQSYADKLRNVQSQQRQGHSLKRSESLNQQEKVARKKWWQCERGRLKKVKGNHKKKQKNIAVNLYQPLSPILSRDLKKGSSKPFQTSAPVVIKSRYQGKQMQAWLQYYQQPKKCLRPKTTRQFAYCVENRRIQQLAFEKSEITTIVE